MRRHQHRGAKDPEMDLGACCVCRKADETVRNIMCLRRLAPVPGTGWGCALCHLPANGAMAVLCDACLADRNNLQLKDVISGYATAKQRVPYESLSDVVFEHNRLLHEMDEAGG